MGRSPGKPKISRRPLQGAEREGGGSVKRRCCFLEAQLGMPAQTASPSTHRSRDAGWMQEDIKTFGINVQRWTEQIRSDQIKTVWV